MGCTTSTTWSQSVTERAKPPAESSASGGAGQAAGEGTTTMNWYAVQTRSRHEKMVARQLESQGFATFLPLTTQLRQWSDRRKLVELPLFPGYTFVRMVYQPEQRLRVLSTEGIVSFVGMQRIAERNRRHSGGTGKRPDAGHLRRADSTVSVDPVAGLRSGSDLAEAAIFSEDAKKERLFSDLKFA